MDFGIGMVNWSMWFWTILYWVVWSIAGFLLVGCIWLIYHYFTFNIKMTYWPVVGTGKDVEGIDRPRRARLKWSKNKDFWRLFWPLFNRVEVEPFEQSYVYPGNNVYALKVGEHFTPMRIRVGDIEKGSVVISPIPYHVRRWQALSLKQNEMEFTKKSWWDDNKTYIVALLTVVFCCSVAALTIWWSYKFAGAGLAQGAQNYASAAISKVASMGAPA